MALFVVICFKMSAERGDVGMNGHLSKPTELEKLMDLLVSLVEKKEK